MDSAKEFRNTDRKADSRYGQQAEAFPGHGIEDS